MYTYGGPFFKLVVFTTLYLVIGICWFVYFEIGSLGQAGLTLLASFLPWLLSSVFTDIAPCLVSGLR